MAFFRAPDGCSQYFTGMSGTIMSYSFDRSIQSQAYKICVRGEEGVYIRLSIHP